jgi:hypothetical protein
MVSAAEATDAVRTGCARHASKGAAIWQIRRVVIAVRMCVIPHELAGSAPRRSGTKPPDVERVWPPLTLKS